MAEHVNAKLYRKAFDAFQTRDYDTMKGTIAADCVWHEAGSSEAIRGREAIIDRFRHMTGDMEFSVSIDELVADDRGFMALLDVEITRGDDRIQYDVVERGHVEDGMLVERWAYMDAVPQDVASFFS